MNFIQYPLSRIIGYLLYGAYSQGWKFSQLKTTAFSVTVTKSGVTLSGTLVSMGTGVTPGTHQNFKTLSTEKILEAG